MIRLVLSAIFIIALSSCSRKLKVITVDSFDNLPKLEEVEGYERVCSEAINYAPDKFTQQRTIRVNVHFMNNLAGTANFSHEEGEKYYRSLLFNANKRLGKNEKMNLPVGNDTPVLDPSYRYKLYGIVPEDSGFYTHKDEKHYYFMNKGKGKNNYNKDVVKKYAINLDSVLNIFAISHPQDSLKSKKYKAFGTGIALGNALKISGIFSNKQSKPWSFGTLMNHEIGHVLGLAHAWTKYDGCDDTPVHPNCWSGNDSPPCDGPSSNNVMDYNNSQMAFSACQLGKIHKGINTLGSRTRGLVEEDWCKPDTEEPIVITEHYEWKGDRDLNKDIYIMEGGRLDLHCRLSMSAGRKIIVESGGELHIHKHATLHNSCGDLWGGIEIEAKKTTEEQLFIYGNPKIEDHINVKTLRS